MELVSSLPCSINICYIRLLPDIASWRKKTKTKKKPWHIFSDDAYWVNDLGKESTQ